MNDFEFKIKKLKPIEAYQILEYYATNFGESIIDMLSRLGCTPDSEHVYYFDPKKAKTRFQYSDAKQYIGIFYCRTASNHGFNVDGTIYHIGLVYMDHWIDGSEAENAYMVEYGCSINIEVLSKIYNYLRIETNAIKKSKQSNSKL